MFLQLLLFGLYSQSAAEKCYSCSSAYLHAKWPKDDDTNRLQFLSDFPLFSNESCDSIKGAIPVVDCPNSVCIKAVIKEPPAKRDVCVESGAIIRDCWSRVMKNSGTLKPQTRNSLMKMKESVTAESTIGYIYTCNGFLCNSSPKEAASHLIFLISLLFI